MIGERFHVERCLGRGGMAVVYLARDEALDRLVALEVLEVPTADGDDGRRRFLREARLAARLSHPNVVTVFDTGEQDGAPYIVMEYVDGTTLADLVTRRRRLPPEEVVALARQACAGLQHAHESGLVHRDVKPQNLLVRPDGTLKISDFGIAVAGEATRITQDGTILGTAAYLAPEQVAGEQVTPAADVYGLGAALYEALSGRPPVKVDSLAELSRVLAPPPEPLRALAPDIPPALERAVMWALERQPESRPESASAFARALEEPAAEAPTVRLRRPPRRPSRRAAAAAGVAALGVAAAAIAVAAAGLEGTPAPVDPVPRRGDAEQQARAVSQWLQANSEDQR